MKGFIVAGEASGDLYASKLAEELGRELPGLSLSAIGGERLASQGVTLVSNYADISVVGIWEVLSHWRRIRKAHRDAVAWIRENNPDFVILVDFPDFNFLLMRAIRNWYRGKIIYFVSPQVWAWRKKRRHVLKRFADHLIVILPFEQAIYEEIGFRAEYLGHPLVDIVASGITAEEFRSRHGFKPNSRLIAVFPGSRKKEIEHHSSVLRELIDKLKISYADLEFCVVAASDDLIDPLRSVFGSSRISVIPRVHYEALSAAHLVIAKSGTTTLEAAISEKPAVVFYKVEPLSYAVGRMLVKVPFVSLPNLIMNDTVYPEFVQSEMTVSNLFTACQRFLDDTDLYISTVERLSELKSLLGERGFFGRAARAVAGWVHV